MVSGPTYHPEGRTSCALPFLSRIITLTPRFLAFGLGMATLLAVVAPVPATAASSVTTTGSCTDGGKVIWQTKVLWGANYRQAGADRVSVGVAGWTTKARQVPTDSAVTTYSNGVLGQRLTTTATVDYQLGKRERIPQPSRPAVGARSHQGDDHRGQGRGWQG